MSTFFTKGNKPIVRENLSENNIMEQLSYVDKNQFNLDWKIIKKEGNIYVIPIN